MADVTVFFETINSVPPELEEQTHDLEKLIDDCKMYMREWGVSSENLRRDLNLILGE